jgi:hypothetical protein
MATTTFNDLITFSRGSNATVTGSNGLIQWAPNNLLLNSESFEAAGWDKLNATIYPNRNFANLAVGPELVTNGDFSAGATGWTVGPNTVISGGGAVSTATPSSGTILQQAAVQPGANKWVIISFVVSGWTGGNLLVYSNDNTIPLTGANGVFSFLLFSTMSSGTGFLIRAEGTPFTGTIDNISVKEITPAAATAPNGTQTADTLLTSGNAGAQRIGLSGAPSSSTTGISTYSVYVKAGTAQFVQILHGSDANAFANFDVASGTLGTRGTGASSTITDAGNGWYRCTLTFNIPSGSPWYIYVAPSASAAYGAAFTATVAGLLLWGAQLELGSTATTYNNTTVRNLLGFSEAFDNAAWTKTNSAIVTGAQANPINGLFNAQKLMENTATGEHAANSAVITAPAAGTICTVSFYAKAAERYKVGVTYPTVGDASIAWDLRTGQQLGASGGSSFISSSIAAVGNGWYRCSMTFNRPTLSNTGNNFHILPDSATSITNRSYTGDGNSGIYLYGAQLSNSASLDPYVPTPGAAPSSTAYYGPRFDYDPATLAARGLLIEEQRVNLVLYSDQFDNAYWSEIGIGAISAGTFPSPDGTATADRMIATVGAGVHAAFTTTAVTAATGVNHAWTVYVKKDTHRFVYLCQNASSSNNITAVFDLDGAGTTATQTGVGPSSGTIASTSIQNVGNGWFRLSLVGAVTGATRFCVVGFAAAATGNTITSIDGNVTFTAAGTEAVLLWGAQLEAGAFATSYIPTIASTVTRSADVATITGSLFSQWWNANEGAFLLEYAQGIGTTARAATVASDGTNNNTIEMYLDGSNDATTLPFYGVNVAGVAQAAISFAVATQNATHKMGTAYQANNFAGSVDGSIAATDTSGSLPTVNRLSIGSSGTAATAFANGHIRSIRYVPVRAADFQLQALTELPLVPTLDVDFINNLYEA